MRFCTSCQATKDEEGGEFRRVRRTARWVCKGCVEHKTVSIYKGSGNYDPKALQTLLNTIKKSLQ